MHLAKLDHVALVVRDTEQAIEDLARVLGTKVVDHEELDVPPVRLTYLDAGVVTVQLVEPKEGNIALAAHLAEHGEGLHHVCFEVDDLVPAVRRLAGGRDPELIIEGRGRTSAFLPGPPPHGLLIELTQLRGSAATEGEPEWT